MMLRERGFTNLDKMQNDSIDIEGNVVTSILTLKLKVLTKGSKVKKHLLKLHFQILNMKRWNK